MKAIGSYFNGFPNDFVKELYAEELSYIKPSDYGRLFDHIIGHNPASWRPDVKAIKDAITALKIDTLAEPAGEKVCPACGNRWSTTGICPECNYAGSQDGTPEEYKAWWTSWKQGREPRFDVQSILENLVTAKSLPESGK